MQQMEAWSGFFPATPELNKFGELMLEDSKQLDVLGSWLDGEMKLRHLFSEASLVMLPYSFFQSMVKMA